MTQHIPREIYHSILEYLPLQNLFGSANLVCHEFYDIIQHDVNFQKELYLNNCSRDFESVEEYYFDEKLESTVMVVLRSGHNGNRTDICVMEELMKIQNPFWWINSIKFQWERPLVLMRVYKELPQQNMVSSLIGAIFKQASQKTGDLFFEEMCLLYQSFQEPSNPNIFELRDISGSTLLMSLAYFNSYRRFIWLCENVKTPILGSSNYLTTGNRTFGQNCLHIACARNSMKIVEYLIERTGIDVNLVDRDGYTCLHLAASKSNLILCTYLIEHGADKHRMTLNGLRPMHLAKATDQKLKKLLLVKPMQN